MGSKKGSSMVLVPVAGLFLKDAPQVPLSVTPDLGERLMRTGAYIEGDPGKDAEGKSIEPLEWDGSGCDLDFYDNPEPAAPVEPQEA